MSTRIKSIVPDSGTALTIGENPQREGNPYIRIVGEDGYGIVCTVKREEFLAAVSQEFRVVITDPAVHDVFVMDKRGEPLEVTEGNHRILVGGVRFPRARDPQDLLDIARKYAVAANWLREHPPVDKAQVKVLADLLNEVDPARTAITETTARRLLETGKVTVTP